MRVSTICWFCKHRDMHSPGPQRYCKAFPQGIPPAIYDDGFDHRKPYEVDGGVRFEPKSQASEDIVKTFWGAEPRPDVEPTFPEFDEAIKQMLGW